MRSGCGTSSPSPAGGGSATAGRRGGVFFSVSERPRSRHGRLTPPRFRSAQATLPLQGRVKAAPGPPDRAFDGEAADPAPASARGAAEAARVDVGAGQAQPVGAGEAHGAGRGGGAVGAVLACVALIQRDGAAGGGDRAGEHLRADRAVGTEPPDRGDARALAADLQADLVTVGGGPAPHEIAGGGRRLGGGGGNDGGEGQGGDEGGEQRAGHGGFRWIRDPSVAGRWQKVQRDDWLVAGSRSGASQRASNGTLAPRTSSIYPICARPRKNCGRPFIDTFLIPFTRTKVTDRIPTGSQPSVLITVLLRPRILVF